MLFPAPSERAERRAVRQVEKASGVREGAERRAVQRVEKASDVGGARPMRAVRQTGPGTMLV